MGTKKHALFLTSVIPVAALVLVLVLMLVLSACGVSTGGTAGTPPGGLPDSVRIEIDAASVTPTRAKPVLTLGDAALVRQLYATIYALPVLPANRACTDELGPHYTLTFRQGTATLTTVHANRDGCRPVTIAGATLDRHGTSAFWQQLDQAIVAATPLLSPDRLAIAFTPHAGQAPQSAQITSAATARQLYDAILALPLASGGPECPAAPVLAYQLVFFSGEQAVPGYVSDTCQMVVVEGGYQSRGGAFAMNDQFRSVLRAVLSGAAFAAAQPDLLALSVAKGHTANYQANVTTLPDTSGSF
jgi:hypothetical protein